MIGVHFLLGGRDGDVCLFATTSRLALRLPSGYWGLFPQGKRGHGMKLDHSPQSSAKVKNAWSYTSTPPVPPHGVVLR